MVEIDVALHWDITLFIAGAVTIGFAGSKLAGLADRFADRTGLGEAITGAVVLGLITALPGVTASVTAAAGGYPALAISNALGGIAVQTAFLAVGDLFYTRANLEHAAASLPNMMQVSVLVVLLTLVLLALSGPEFLIAHVHPMTPALYAAAAFGFWLILRAREAPMWKPARTFQTVDDTPEPETRHESLVRLVAAIVPVAALVLVAGVVCATTAGNLADETGISESIVGGLFLAVATSLPELVTTIAAVRRGALTLAVSEVVGGNVFDVLFVSTADLAYLPGSIYHAEAVGNREIFLNALTVLLNIVLLTGLISRQRRGPVNIGFESASILLLYLGGVIVVWVAM